MPIDPGSTERARTLRRDQSTPEAVLWSRLRGRRLGFKFRRQQPVGPYVADFYCAEAKLVVELDGHAHRERRGRDAERNRWMESEGIGVLRISVSEFTKKTDDCVAHIRSIARSRISEREDRG